MATAPLDASVYRRAEQLLPHNRVRLVRNARVRPRWIGDGSAFWYRAERGDGHEFVLVEPAARSRQPAFDHARLASALALAAQSGSAVDASTLPFRALEFVDGGVEFAALGSYWRCALDSYVCERVPGYSPPIPLEVRSPDGTWAAFRREHDLWVRSVATGEERALTSDGAADHAYGVPPDSLASRTLFRRLGLAEYPPIVAWSPDSRRLLTHRTDQRGVRLQHLVESSPADRGRPVLHAYHYAMPGDDVVPRAEIVVLDVEIGVATARTEPLLMPMMSPVLARRAWWAADSSAVYYLAESRDRRSIRLERLDALTGESRTLVEESGEPWIDANQVVGHAPIGRVLPGDDVLWWSQRDGWGHLYLYDGRSGQLRSRVTAGEWLVQQVLHIDLDARAVYFLAAGLVAANPYRRQVCRASLDGSEFTRLTDDEFDHAVVVPENGTYFVDSASTTTLPPVTTVRDWTGAGLVELERADVSRLVAAGWSPPEPFSVQAADGETDLHGLLYLPLDFDASRSYPVIDHPYPGPHLARVLPTFEQSPAFWDAEALAALGFVVFALNGSGTPGRDKAFHDCTFRAIGDVGLDDHVVALRQLARTRPWLDLDRVGAFGLSRGGGRVVRAMCEHPDFYRVGVAEAGAHDLACYQLGVIEAYGGPFDPELCAAASNLDLAERLDGKLLLIHGELDDNTHPQQTMRLVDRLIAANKDFELLVVPGAEHLFVGYEHYVRRRSWDFLVRHLLGTEPPAGYRLASAPIDIDTFSEMLG